LHASFQSHAFGRTNKRLIGFNLSFLFDRQDLLGEAIDSSSAGPMKDDCARCRSRRFYWPTSAKAHQAIESAARRVSWC